MKDAIKIQTVGDIRNSELSDDTPIYLVHGAGMHSPINEGRLRNDLQEHVPESSQPVLVLSQMKSCGAG